MVFLQEFLCKAVSGRVLAIFGSALICNANLAGASRLRKPPVFLPDSSPAKRSFISGLMHSAPVLQEPARQIPIDVLQIYGLPLGISNASLGHAKNEARLRLSIPNSSNEQILSLRYWLLIVDCANGVRSVLDQSETLKLDAYAARVVSFPAPPRAETFADDRVFLMVAQVIGRDSIWEVQQARSAFLAYVKGDSYAMPDVLRLLNQVDSPIGFSPILMKPRN
jgi:hypothetical protein